MALYVKYNNQSKRMKVTPSMTMFHVLTDALEQYGLLDSHQYQLVHRGKTIDLSIPFRLTGISNNASVDLFQLDEALEVQQVRVCIQLHDGKRVQATFGSDTTIENILTFFKLLPASEKFCLGFLRRGIDSNAFSSTTLKELGILSGSAMFRVQSANEQLAASAAQSPSEPSQTPRVIAAPTAPSSSASPSIVSEALGHIPSMPSDDVEMSDVSAEDKTTDVGIQIMTSYDALQILRNNSFDTVSRGAIVTLLKIVTNILSDPENEKLRTIRLSNATFHRLVGQVKGGIDVLEEGLRLLSIEADDLNISPEERPLLQEKQVDPSFDVFKSQITRMQMQPRGSSMTEVLVDALKLKQEQLVGCEKPPRNTTVILEVKQESDRTDLAREIGERSDAQLLMSSLKARQDKMEKAKTFRTRAMRELDELKRKRVFQMVLIRVQFPDRAMMQASFHPNETIQDVMNHVTECLDDQYKVSKFYLYVTPPTQKLAATKTLVELNLLPAALTYLSWLEVPPQAEVASIGFYFRADVLANECADVKERVGPLQKTEYPKPLQVDESLPNAATTDSREKPTPQKDAQAKSSKKPSWVKL
ncbi:unnamed protein product [Peronospora belbahrii]|uniref:UBX domain-containing protein n=1 Tax=Peronospora belbahrii TaxID=622444 RepID=A0AAU9KXW2_9STRA|nr:unnamed protein product [Peronospora belbahrii]